MRIVNVQVSTWYHNPVSWYFFDSVYDNILYGISNGIEIQFNDIDILYGETNVFSKNYIKGVHTITQFSLIPSGSIVIQSTTCCFWENGLQALVY